MNDQEKIVVTVVRADKVNQEKSGSGLFVPTPTTAYEIKKIENGSDVRLTGASGTRILLIGAALWHSELEEINALPQYKVVVLDTPK